MKVLALVDAPDHVCCRYRIRAFAPALEAAGAVADRRGPGRRRRRPLASAPAGRGVRRGGPPAEAAVGLGVRLAAAIGPSARLRPRRRRLLARLLRRSRPRQRPADAARFARTVRGADAVLAGNDFLVGRAIRAGGDPGKRPPAADLRRPGPLPDPRPRRRPTGSGSSGSARRARCRGSRPAGRSGAGSAAAVPGVDAAGHLRPAPGPRRDAGPASSPGRRRPRPRPWLGGDVGVAMDARRPLEPGQVRPEGPAIPGRRPPGRRQPGRRPRRDGPARPRRASCPARTTSGSRPSPRSPTTTGSADAWDRHRLASA